MNPYWIYLKAELGKLRDSGVAEEFLSFVPEETLTACGVARKREKFTEQFGSQASVNALIESLSDSCVLELTKFCDRWRNNGVFKKLVAADTWLEVDAPTSEILLQQAEPELAHIFQRNEFELLKIVADPELLAHEPYRSRKPGETVSFSTCLAKSSKGRCRIFDGMHRAIQLARNGCGTISLCYSEE